MLTPKLILISLATLCICLLGSGAAVASTEIGVRCQADGAINGYANVNTTTPAFAAPTSGVITHWGKNVFVAFPSNPIVMVVVHGSGQNWKVVSQTQPEFLSAVGEAGFPAQVPIAAGDRIGEAGVTEQCPGAATDHTDYMNIFPNLTTPGQSLTLTVGSANRQTALWATLEPDADHDGFGDESQDKCPANAQLQIACPIPVLSAYTLKSRTLFQALITTDLVTTVSGVGSVKLPTKKGKKAKTLTLRSKTIATAPGLLNKLSIAYPSALKNALAAMSRNKSLSLSVTLTAVGVSENGIKRLNVKLPGTR